MSKEDPAFLASDWLEDLYYDWLFRGSKTLRTNSDRVKFIKNAICRVYAPLSETLFWIRDVGESMDSTVPKSVETAVRPAVASWRKREREAEHEEERKPSRRDGAKEEMVGQVEEGEKEGQIQNRLEETSASLAAALAVEHKIKDEDTPNDQKGTVSILDDIGSMFDDLADQLDAMLD